MGVFIKSDTNPTTPSPTASYLEKDWGIVRGVTLAAFDFSHPDCIVAAGALPGGTSFANLVAGGAAASVAVSSGSQFPASVTGTLRSSGAGNYTVVNLPASFNLGTAVTRALAILRLRAIKTGWPASQIYGVMGSGTGNGAALQYQVYLQSDASGTIVTLMFRVRGSAGNIDCALTSGAALDALLNGNLHQLGFAFEIVGGFGTGKIYLDGALVATGVAGAMTQFNQAGGTPTLFTAPGVGYLTFPVAAQDTRIGRPSIHDLTSRPELTALALLTRDAEAGAGFVS